MDAQGRHWYESCMRQPQIPEFALFGETSAFPDVVHCERIGDRAPKHGWVIEPHRHPQMAQVFHISAGHAEVCIDGENDRMHPGDYLFVPSTIVHGFTFEPRTDGLVMSFPQPVVSGIAGMTPALAHALSLPFCGAADVDLARLFDQFWMAFGTKGPFRAQTLVGLAHAVLARTAETAPDAGKATTPALVERLDALIARHCGDSWRPRDYAQALVVTTGHLSRVCRTTLGMSAANYIEQTVMAEACRLLAFTQIPVASVGYRLGYADPSYFSRRFRARVGLSPSDYRARFVG